MSLARDYLKDYLRRENCSQAEFARRCEMTPPNLSDVLSSNAENSVEISSRNVGKLVRGFAEEQDQLEFLAAYLRDEIPDGYADRVDVDVRNADAVREAAIEDPTAELLAGFAALPSKKLKRAVLSMLAHLRVDTEFRDLFLRTMSYLMTSEDRMVTRAQKVAAFDSERTAGENLLAEAARSDKAAPTPRGPKRAPLA